MEEALQLVRSKDTKDQMAGVDRLHQLLGAAYSKPLSSSHLNSLVDACMDLLNHDNFRVSQGALQALASAAVLAADHLRIHFTVLIPAAVERLGYAKQSVRDAARGLLLTFMEVSSPTIIVERAGSYAWEHNNWRILEEFARTVTSAINLFPCTELPLQRAIMPHILHMLNDPNHVIREVATACIEAKEINSGLERIELKLRSSDGASNLGSVSEHTLANLNPKRCSHKPRSSLHETSLFGGLQMTGYQLNGEVCCEKSATGCLEKVANLFDIKSGVSRNKLLTEKPHQDGSNVSKSLSDLSTMSSPLAKELGDKLVVSGRSCFSTKSEGTPVKMLMAQEMTKDLDSSFLEVPAGYWRQENERCSENSNEQKIGLIRQKFMDAKRLSTGENLRQTKEFQDALDFLSSNQHLFLKVLQEPNSLISHHLCERQPISLPKETKRITVLKPSKMVFNEKFPASGNRNEKHVKKSSPRNRFGHSAVASSRRFDECSTQPTRIVVLKPTPGMLQDTTTDFPSTPSTENFREVAKEITQQMRENLAGHREDETVLSSVLSYDYTGDESSFHKSEAEFVEKVLSSEVTSPAFKHSWDYINRNGGPYYSSSLSRASYTPESPVARDAKKRLSERWAVMVSQGARVEQKNELRTSSTLGEMLALSEVQNTETCNVVNSKSDEAHRASTSCLISNTGVVLESTGSLLRSKSLPAESLDQESKMRGLNKQAAKSSFKGKVTSLFSQRSKKPCKGKIDDYHVSCHAEASVHRMPCESDNNSDIQSPDLKSPNRTLWLELNEKPRQGLTSQQGAWSTVKSAVAGMSGEKEEQLEPAFEEGGSNTMFSSDATMLDPLGSQPMLSLGKSNLIDKSPPIGSIARTLSWDESSAQPAPSGAPAGGSPSEGEWLFLVQSLLSAADLEDESQLRSKWHSPDSPLDPLLREKYVNLICKEPFNPRQLRSNCCLVFDSVNAALVDLTGIVSRGKRLVTSIVGDLLADTVWSQLRHWFLSSDCAMEDADDNSNCNNNNNAMAERVVQKEFVGRGWEDLFRIEIDIIGKEIQGKLMEELVLESLAEWTGVKC